MVRRSFSSAFFFVAMCNHDDDDDDDDELGIASCRTGSYFGETGNHHWLRRRHEGTRAGSDSHPVHPVVDGTCY